MPERPGRVLVAGTAAIVAVAVFVGAYFVGAYFFTPRIPPGWTSLAVLLLLIGGFVIASTGVTGLYIGKISSKVKERPLFVVEEEVGAFAKEFNEVRLDDDRLERLP